MPVRAADAVTNAARPHNAHIGVDDESGLVHSVECTAASEPDVTQVHKLLHGREVTVCGDSSYISVDQRAELRGVKAAFWVAEKPSKLRALKRRREYRDAERWERFKASLRAKVERPFRVLASGSSATRRRAIVA